MTLLTVLMVAAAAFVLARFGRLQAVSLIFMVLGSSFMVAHWWLLGRVVLSLVGARGMQTLVWGLLSVFPVAAALAVFFVSIGLDCVITLPSLLGIVAMPTAITLVCLWKAITGLQTAYFAGGTVHG